MRDVILLKLFKPPLKINALSSHILKNNIFHSSHCALKPHTFLKCNRINYCICRNNSHLQSPSGEPSKITPDIKSHIEDWGEFLRRWYKKYQDFVGVSEVLQAQDKVSLLTNKLLDVQIRRRQLQRDVDEVHQQLLSTHQRITKSELYSEDHYALFEKARQLSTTLKTLQSQFIQTEEEERSLFTQLSTAIKFCHERERAQTEQSKYWSILISLISATLAALITSINNWVRIKEIKDHASSLHKDAVDKTSTLQDTLLNIVNARTSVNGPPYETNSGGNFTVDRFLEDIQVIVRGEVQNIVNELKELPLGISLKDPQNGPMESSLTELDTRTGVAEYSRLGSLVIGALIGCLISYTIFTSGSGG